METPLARAHLAQTGHTDGTEKRVYLAKTSERQRDELFHFLRTESEPLRSQPLPLIAENESGDAQETLNSGESPQVLNSTMKEVQTPVREPKLSPIKSGAIKRKAQSDVIDSDGGDSTYQPGSAEKRSKIYCRRWSGVRPDPKDFDEEDRMRQNYIEHLNLFRKEQNWSDEEKRCLKYFENVVKAPTLENVKTILQINGKQLAPCAVTRIYKKIQNCEQYLTFEYYQHKTSKFVV